MKIIWSPLAIERIEEISDYIADDNPSAASKWVDSIFEKIDLLKGNPQMGRIVPELAVPSIREIIFGNYRIIYRHEQKTTIILTVRSFRQILPIEDVDPDHS
jgi:plasmid stabilization system protein ParE